MTYKKGMLKYGKTWDSTEDYDVIYAAYLPHSCDEWVIGGKEEIANLMTDLENILVQILKEEA